MHLPLRTWFSLFALLIVDGSARLRAMTAPETTVASAKTAAELQRTWHRIERRDPNLGARDVYGLLLTAVAANWRPDLWDAVIARGEELHDRDPGSPTYGNYRWYWREPKPNDRNAVEFSMQSASLTWAALHERLPESTRTALKAALALGAEGLLRHRVDVSYTNIFLMRIANCALIGDALDRPDLKEHAAQWFDEWFRYTRSNGIHEFSSPTYYGTDLTDLGGIARFSQSEPLRRQAQAALRLVWSDIAANWFAPFEGIAGAHSRDYGFLTGHGYLDQQLLRAGWLQEAVVSESHAAIDDLTFLPPPADVHALATEIPRTVVQRWGAKPEQVAIHYVGRSFSLGTAGTGYGAQDRVLALTFAGGPHQPIASFALDYRNDPYGQTKIGTADGHAKLTHLLPTVVTVQHGAEALLLAAYDAAHGRNPAGGKAEIEYQGVAANLVLPSDVAVWSGGQRCDTATATSLTAGTPLCIRYHQTAVAALFLGGRADDGAAPALQLIRDGSAVGAQRMVARLAPGKPRRPVWTALWVTAAEDIATDEQFAAFCRQAEAAARTVAIHEAGTLRVALHGRNGPLALELDPARGRVIRLEGGEPSAGIFTLNGRELGLSDSR